MKKNLKNKQEVLKNNFFIKHPEDVLPYQVLFLMKRIGKIKVTILVLMLHKAYT
jgi:hypothetical protein